MTCGQFTELMELYAIGALEKTDSESLKSHLESGCETCGPKLDQLLLEAAFISGTVPLVDPPLNLRDRIAASVSAAPPVISMPKKRRFASIAPWLVAAAAVAGLVVGIGYEENARRADAEAASASVQASEQAAARRTAEMLSILQAPGTKQVAFNIDKSELPQGTLFIHRRLGVTMVVAHLPAAPKGWKYESWIVPKAGAPRPVESFATNSAGIAFTVIKGPVDLDQWAAVAVSVEPEESNPVKPTKVIFASPV